MKKYLEIDVTKTLVTTLYFSVDDEDPRFANYFKKQGLDKLNEFNQVVRNIPISKAVSETIDSSDWEFQWNPSDEDYDVIGISEVEQEEAEMYTVFDVETNKIEG